MWTGPSPLTSSLLVASPPNNLPGGASYLTQHGSHLHEPSTSSIFDQFGETNWSSLSVLKNRSPSSPSFHPSVYSSYLGLLPACDLFANSAPTSVFSEACSQHVAYTRCNPDVVPRASISPTGPFNYLGFDLASVPMPPVGPAPVAPPPPPPPAPASSPPLLSPQVTPPPATLLSQQMISLVSNVDEIAVGLPKAVSKCGHKTTADSNHECNTCNFHEADGMVGSIGITDLVNIVFKTAEKLKPQLNDGVSREKAVLDRKRKQNKIAAARYRNRQKDKRAQMLNELSSLAEKNEELRGMAADLELEITEVRDRLLRLDRQ
ncbi:hypothetical protein L596_004697 [Steinernema carpocapsae]|uniref:BZIP domain-containing protein n=1 Tax=Steinernema carpocapsae TaxID=34508 RepID=A0A4U8UWS2_STECR|nr:hypothetical protein L596_004697 [Steinernema carpocapsae]